MQKEQVDASHVLPAGTLNAEDELDEPCTLVRSSQCVPASSSRYMSSLKLDLH